MCYSSELMERLSTPPRAGYILNASMRERSMRGDTGIMGCSYEMGGSSCWQNIDQRWARGTGLPTTNAASREGVSRPKSQIEATRLVKRSQRYAGPMLGPVAVGVLSMLYG